MNYISQISIKTESNGLTNLQRIFFAVEILYVCLSVRMHCGIQFSFRLSGVNISLISNIICHGLLMFKQFLQYFEFFYFSSLDRMYYSIPCSFRCLMLTCLWFQTLYVMGLLCSIYWSERWLFVLLIMVELLTINV